MALAEMALESVVIATGDIPRRNDVQWRVLHHRMIETP